MRHIPGPGKRLGTGGSIRGVREMVGDPGDTGLNERGRPLEGPQATTKKRTQERLLEGMD